MIIVLVILTSDDCVSQDLPNVSSVDKALYVADWTAKISQSQGSESSMAAARRRLPSAPSKDEASPGQLDIHNLMTDISGD